MTKLTWRGENQLHGDQAGPSFTTWWGIKFPIGEAVEVTNNDMIRRAKTNPFFIVEDGEPVKRGPGRPPKVKNDDQDQG